MDTEEPTLADEPQPAKPLPLDYVSAKLRGRPHGGLGSDWWALWAFVLWFILVGALACISTYLSRR